MIKIDSSAFQASINAATAQLATVLDESTMRSVGMTGADIFRDEAALNAGRHVKTGGLQRSIIVKRLTEESNGTRQAYLVTVRSGRSAGGNGAYYWRFLEFGTAHSPAYPFLRPAFESKKQEAAAAMSNRLAKEIAIKMGGAK